MLGFVFVNSLLIQPKKNTGLLRRCYVLYTTKFMQRKLEVVHENYEKGRINSEEI